MKTNAKSRYRNRCTEKVNVGTGENPKFVRRRKKRALTLKQWAWEQIADQTEHAEACAAWQHGKSQAR